MSPVRCASPSPESTWPPHLLRRLDRAFLQALDRPDLGHGRPAAPLLAVLVQRFREREDEGSLTALSARASPLPSFAGPPPAPLGLRAAASLDEAVAEARQLGLTERDPAGGARPNGTETAYLSAFRAALERGERASADAIADEFLRHRPPHHPRYRRAGLEASITTRRRVWLAEAARDLDPRRFADARNGIEHTAHGLARDYGTVASMARALPDRARPPAISALLELLEDPAAPLASMGGLAVLGARGDLDGALRPPGCTRARLGLPRADAQALEARLAEVPDATDALERLLAELPPDRGRAAYQRHRRQLGLSLLAATLVALGETRFSRRDHSFRPFGLALLRRLNERERRDLHAQLFRDPRLARKVLRFAAVESIQLRRMGNLHSAAPAFLEAIRTERRAIPRDEEVVDLLRTSPPVPRASMPEPDTPLEPHGRSLHFEAGGRAFVLKLEKEGEGGLEQEARMNMLLERVGRRLGLESLCPHVVGLMQPYPEWIDQSSVERAGAAPDGPRFALAAARRGLLAEVPRAYAVHLADVEDFPTMARGALRALRDVGRLGGRAGLVAREPADLWHNTDGAGRRYHWDVDVLRVAVGIGRAGPGRIDRWPRAVEFANFGPTGRRDNKSLIHPTGGEDPAFRGCPRAAFISLLGDNLLAWTLTICRWWTAHPEQDRHEIAALLEQGFTAFFTEYTRRPRSASAQFLRAIVDWKRLTGQIAYAISGDYVADVAQDRLRRGIFGPGVLASAARPDVGWDHVRGWSLDGHTSDLGPHNGPLPLPELFQAIALTTHFAFELGP